MRRANLSSAHLKHPLATAPQHHRCIPAAPFHPTIVDRITRDDDMVDGTKFFEMCKEHDVLIITKDMDFDPRNHIALDMFMFQLMGSRHQNMANLSGMMRGMMQAAEEGKLLNGVTPFGYDRFVPPVDAQVARGSRRIRTWLRINEAEAKVLRLIHEWIPLMGTQKVAEKLNRLEYRFPVKSFGTQQILGKTTRLWRGTDVLRLVRSPLYMGVKRWGGKRRNSKYLREMKGPYQVPIASLRIVDAAIWHSNNTLVDGRNPRTSAARSANSPYLFSGPRKNSMFRCALCHGPMKGSRKRSGHKRYRIYECSNAHDLRTCTGGSISERIVAKAVRRYPVRVLAKVGLDRVLDEAINLQLNDDYADEVQRLEATLAELDVQRTKLLRLYLNGAVTEIEHKREKSRIDEEQARIKEQRSRAALRTVERVTVEELRSYMGADLLEWIPKLRGRRLSRVTKLVFAHFEVQATGNGPERRGRLQTIRYSEDFARLSALTRPKPGKNGKIVVLPRSRLLPLPNH